MPLRIREAHASDGRLLNEEWMVVENTGPGSFHTGGCQVVVSPPGGRTARGRVVATLDPGFALGPGERRRLVSGTPNKKAHGSPPADAVPNYHLFVRESYLEQAGVIVRLLRHQVELCRAVFVPGKIGGVEALP
jgi:hypothetical protein